MDDRALLDAWWSNTELPRALSRAGQGAHLVEREGVLASANLAAAYGDLAEAYLAAAIEAWAVWVPQADRESAAFLEARGHVLDGSPTAMGAELDGITVAPGELGAEVIREADPALLGRLNDLAYGYESSFERALGGMSPDVGHWYLAREGGEPVCGLMTFDHGTDAEVDWVATVPEARGRGHARSLLGLALLDARERGCTSTTLIATKLGRPVYERLGYRALGTIEMWEKRRPPRPALPALRT